MELQSSNFHETNNEIKESNTSLQPPKIIEPLSPESTVTGDDDSLNNDLLSVSGSPRRKQLTRRSVDSISMRKSFESSVGGKSTRTFGFGNEIHSGSQDFSPLGNNSIYEIVMNTRRKNWLGYPTSYDIPPVILSKNEIERGWKNQIKNYVESIKSEYTIFESTNNLKNMNRLEQIKQLEDYNTNDDNILDSSDKENDYAYNQQQSTMFLKELSEVPQFYFDKDFQLENPRIFHKVLEGLNFNLQNLKQSENEERQQLFARINDKLNDYLDAVEGLLVLEISKSSHKFYHALSNVDQIQDKVNKSISGIDTLSKGLNDIDENNILKKMEKLQNVIKEKNIEKLEQGLLQVKAILIQAEECKNLFENDKFDECMSLINSINKLIKGDASNDSRVQSVTKDWPYDLLDLRAVPALSETREYLTNMNIEIGGKFSLQLCDSLIDDLKLYNSKLDINEVLDRLQNKIRSKKFLKIDESLQKDITVLITKLFECEELTSAFRFFQERLTTELKNIIKLYLPQEKRQPPAAIGETSMSTADSSDTSVQNIQQTTSSQKPSSGSKLSKLIKDQTPAEFQDTLINIFTNCSEALRRLYRYQKLLLDISLNVIMLANDPNTNEYDMITQLDIRNGINEGIKIIQLRMGKVIIVRRDLTSQLRYDHFLKLYAIVVCFIQECEAVSGEFLTRYLSDVLESQIQAYINFQNINNNNIIRKIVSTDTWMPFIVEPNVQKDVNAILSSMDIDPLSWTNELQLSTDSNEVAQDQKITEKNSTDEKSGEENLEKPTENNNTPANKPMGHRKSVVVGDKTFVASNSLITIIEKIKEIMILSIDLPSIYLPHFEKNLYNLLKTYNTSVLKILNEATTSTAKSTNSNKTTTPNRNYSIMGESLDCLVEFIKIIQRFYRRLMSSSNNQSQDKNKNSTIKQPVNQQTVDYIQLLKMYQTTIEKIYLANAPPPPA